MKKYMYIQRLSILALCSISIMNAEYEVVKTESQLDELIKNNNLVVLMFYYKDDTLTEKKMQYAKYSERLLKRTNFKDRYDDANVMFIEVNIADKNLEQLKAKYNVKKYPTFFLFVGNKSVVDRDGKRAYLQDIPQEDELVEFIERHLRDEINKIVGEEKYDYYQDDENDNGNYYYYPRQSYYPYYYSYPLYRSYGRHRSGRHHSGGHRSGGHRSGGHRSGGHRSGGHRSGGHRSGGHRSGGHRSGGGRHH